MSKYIGRRVKLGMGVEASRGAGVAPTYLVPFDSLSIDDKITQARSVGALGRLEDSEEAFVTGLYSEGAIEGEIRDKSIGLFLYALMGTLNTSGPTDSAYTHAFSIANSNSHQSLAFTIEDDNNKDMYRLAMINSLELTAELDQVVKYSAEFMSKRSVPSTITIPDVVAENKFIRKSVRVKVASSIAGLSGASALRIKSLTLTISKNLVMDDNLGTAEPDDIHNQQLSVEGEITLNFEDNTWKNYFLQNTSRAMEIKLVDEDTVIGAATNPSLTLQMPKVDFFGWEPDRPLDEIVKQTFSFKGSYDVANGLAVISTCSLVNDVASY